ncbi:putative pumilio homolog 8, chloroplastic [Andrographis paniculata]|uniref:putative pumilio homolog 8, chloroplastic n=1 Tax=Andrographis paniculata TaxID=175694 RepID=UPI0021E7EDE0|nr:putative pumilio homolog 8, chloroplastic [Andrographis paniculata]
MADHNGERHLLEEEQLLLQRRRQPQWNFTMQQNIHHNYDNNSFSTTTATNHGGASLSTQPEANRSFDVNKELADAFARCLWVDSHRNGSGAITVPGSSRGQDRINTPFYGRLPTISNHFNQSLREDTVVMRPNNNPCSLTRINQVLDRLKDYWSWEHYIELSPHFHKIVEGRDRQKKDKLIFFFVGYYHNLMMEKSPDPLFPKILDACNNVQLLVVVNDILLDERFFTSAMSNHCKQGFESLIRRIKKTQHAYRMTMSLSDRFWDLVTHPNSLRVVELCLIRLGTGPNEVLSMATICFNYCNFITNAHGFICGHQRSRLLTCLAQASAYLSRDPYGWPFHYRNYVVQKVLDLKDDAATNSVLNCLQGQFVHLAQLKEASNVVEKCIEASTTGMINVVSEILQDSKTPILLAMHQYGNYVIQKALKNNTRVIKILLSTQYSCLMEKHQN